MLAIRVAKGNDLPLEKRFVLEIQLGEGEAAFVRYGSFDNYKERALEFWHQHVPPGREREFRDCRAGDVQCIARELAHMMLQHAGCGGEAGPACALSLTEMIEQHYWLPESASSLPLHAVEVRRGL